MISFYDDTDDFTKDILKMLVTYLTPQSFAKITFKDIYDRD